MKLYKHNVSVPFDFVILNGDHNGAVRLWWKDRFDWLAEHGAGTWHVYNIAAVFTVMRDGEKTAEGNHNITDTILFSFTDAQTAMMFKLTWNGQ